MPWYDDAMRLRDFADALEDAEYADAIDVLKKPYKFEAEYEVWASNNSPDENDAEWNSFIKGLNELAEPEE